MHSFKLRRTLAVPGLATASMLALLPVNSLAQVNQEREESDKPLEEVVVTATSTRRTLSDTPASVSVREGDTLLRRPVFDLADAVRGIPGVDLSDAGLGRRGISIRGMDAGHTLMLIDGERISTSSSAIQHSDFELGWVPSNAIDRIEVVRGPMSSLYGSEALGGVVNMITRSATDHWQGSISQYSSFTSHGQGGDQHKAGFYAGGPLVPGKLGLNVWGELKHRQALRDTQAPSTYALDRDHGGMGHVGLTWTPDARQRMDASVDAGNESQVGWRAASTTGDPDYRANNDVQRRRYSISHKGDWDWGSTQFRLYRTTLKRISTRTDGGEVNSPNRFTDTVADGRVTVTPLQNHRVTLGGEVRRERLEDPSINNQGRKALTHQALYAQDEIQLGQRWNLVLGNRLDHHDAFGWENSPRAYLLFHANEQLTFKAGAARGFRAPTLKQLSPEYESRTAIGGRGIITGNPDLKPETNQSFELGASWNDTIWSAGATIFQNNVKNLIDTIRQPTCFERGKICLAYENVSRARIRGLELTGGVSLPHHLRLDANYTWLQAQDRSEDVPLADRPRHHANITVAWTPLPKLDTRLRAEYVGTRYRSATELDGHAYTLLHWYVDYQVARNVSLHGGIENLTDKRLSNDDADIYSTVDEGRRYFAGVTVNF